MREVARKELIRGQTQEHLLRAAFAFLAMRAVDEADVVPADFGELRVLQRPTAQVAREVGGDAGAVRVARAKAHVPFAPSELVQERTETRATLVGRKPQARLGEPVLERLVERRRDEAVCGEAEAVMSRCRSNAQLD